MNKLELQKRIEGFLWHGGAMVLVFYLDAFLEKSAHMNIDARILLIIGLVIPQITKYLRNKYIAGKI